MKTKLSLIIVSGPNASGKTTLVENNTEFLSSNNFELILPDKILKFATSLTDRPAVVGEYIDAAIVAKKNILIETPFQNESFMSKIKEIEKLGYNTTLYQIFLDEMSESVKRVNERFINGGLYISNQEVYKNYNANFSSIENSFHKFKHAYFINNSAKMDFRFTAQFQSGELVKFNSNDSTYFLKLFKSKSLKKIVSSSDLRSIAKNKDYTKS
ncbi:MAG: hypothetical protein KF862_05185 [Chitinophagaceae bacterium]|nr:hypothetical protein [Chitinophagaceae bacterium]